MRNITITTKYASNNRVKDMGKNIAYGETSTELSINNLSVSEIQQVIYKELITCAIAINERDLTVEIYDKLNSISIGASKRVYKYIVADNKKALRLVKICSLYFDAKLRMLTGQSILCCYTINIMCKG